MMNNYTILITDISNELEQTRQWYSFELFDCSQQSDSLFTDETAAKCATSKNPGLNSHDSAIDLI